MALFCKVKKKKKIQITKYHQNIKNIYQWLWNRMLFGFFKCIFRNAVLNCRWGKKKEKKKNNKPFFPSYQSYLIFIALH